MSPFPERAMRRRLVIVGVVGFWAVMMATLVRRWLLEVRPEFVPGTYRSLLTAERRNFRSRMGIYMPQAGKLKRVGYTQTLFDYREDGKYLIENVTRAEVAVPGFLERAGTFSLTTKVRVGKDHALEALLILLESELGRVECRGHVADGKLVLRAVLKGGEEVPVREVPVPPSEVLAHGLSPLLALPPLRMGMRWSVMSIDPMTFMPSQLDLEVIGRETLEWEGKKWDTHVVAIRAGVLTSKAWVSRDGDVLKEVLPFRVTLIKERVEEEEEGK